MDSVHNVAKKGFGEGTNELYDKARPSYPGQALSCIRSHVRSSPPFKVAELGAGTGIFTRAILAHPDFSQVIAQLKAIEPSEGMRNVFAKQIQDARVSVREGTFAHAPTVDDNYADLVVVAQAWHWCPDYAAGVREISRMLKPEGVAFFIWNLEDREAAPWVAQVRDAYEKHEQNTPQYRLNLWRATFETEAYAGLFDNPEEFSWEHMVPTTEQGVIDRMHSKSFITQLSDEERSKVTEDARRYIKEDQSKVWVDKERGVFQYPYRTNLVVMRKKSPVE